MNKKIKLEDITPAMLEKAQGIVRYIIKIQSMPTDQKLGRLICAAILGLDPKKRIEPKQFLRDGLDDGLCAGLCDGLHASLHAGLYAGLRDGLHAGLYAGLDDGLYDGLDAGLDAGLYDGLRAGLDAGLDAGLYDGLDASLYAGLDASLYAGLDASLRAGLDAGLYDGLDAGLYAGLDDGLYAGLYASLHAGLYAGLDDGLKNSKIKYLYCGVFWSWWLCRYLIAHEFGCKFDMQKLGLLWGFCRFARIILVREFEGKIYPFIAKTPTCNFIESGKTQTTVSLPIFKIEGKVSLGALEVHFKNNQRHLEGSSAMKMGEYQRWFLNGISVEQWMAETPPDKLDAKEILKIENVDQRRETLKRLGVENLVKQLGGKIIDTDYTSKFGKISRYELLQLDLGLEAGVAHFLKMNNPSIDAIHVEGVPRECFTVQEAINWRRYGTKAKQWQPEDLT